jgi:predicted nucleotidyltransferase/PHD/YefM family antitoxin component YafN of YafNO toxin-antitoxin module
MTSSPPPGDAQVVPVAQARSGLSGFLREFRDRPDAEPIVIGAHRRPEVVLMPYARYASTRDASRRVGADQHTADQHPADQHTDAQHASADAQHADADPTDADGHRSMLDELRRRRTLVARLARANRVESVRVFGSVARGEETPASDIDLLVTPADDASLFDLAQFELDLEALFERPVDVVSSRSLDPERDRAVLDSAIEL